MAGRGLEQDKEQLDQSVEAVDRDLRGAEPHVGEDPFRTVFEAIDQGMAIAEVILNDAGESVDYKILAANEAFAGLTGRLRAELLSGKTARELIPTLEDFWPQTMGGVAVTGEPVRFEKYSASVDRFFEVEMFRVGDPSQHQIASIYRDITAQRQAERTLESGQRMKAYLLKLSLRLRPIECPVDIMSAAAEAVARELGVAAAGYIEMAEDGETALTGGQFEDGRLPALVGPCKLSEFGEGIGAVLKAGQDLFVPDILAYSRGPAGGSEKARDFKLRAAAAVPLIKNGRLVAFFYATHHEPRPWESWEQEIFRQTAEWTWAAVERARAETALRESLEKYQTLFDSIDQGYMVIELLGDESGAPADFRVVQGNRVFERQTGLTDYVGKRRREIFSSSSGDRWLKLYAQVAETGEPARLEDYSESLKRWYSVFAARLGGAGSRLVNVVFDDITERKEAEEQRRIEEERNAYRWRLTDALRPLEDPVEIQKTALQVLSEKLGAHWAFYGHADAAQREVLIENSYPPRQPEIAPMRCSVADFTWTAMALQDGRPLVINDLRAMPLIPEAERLRLEQNRVGALIATPLVKDGKVVATLSVVEPLPRAWTPLEVELAWHTGERTWAALERARAEAALRASEEKYRTLFDSIDNAIAVLEVLYDEQGRPDNLRFVQTNKVFEKAAGFKDHIGKTSQELIPNLEDSCIEKYARVAETGEPIRFESFSRDFGCWMDIFASRLGGPGSRLVNVLFEDITERKRAEVELRDREESKAYQLQLSDALRPLLDPIEIQGTASTLLGEELHADRALYVEIDEEKREIFVAREFTRTAAPSLVGRHDLEESMWLSPGFRRGRPTVVNDVGAAPFVPQELVEKMQAREIASFVTVPLLKADRLVSALFVTSATPRIWRPAEVSRVQDTADRTWAAVEHARADAARRSSDEKYGTLFNAIDQAIAVVEVVYNDEGEAIDLRYLETNSVWERQNGITNAAGRMLTEILPQIGLPCIRRYARVAETGEPGRFEAHVEHLGIWLDISATRVGGPGSRMVSIVFYDITERKKAENELRRSEERKAFLLKLSDALRPHADAVEVQGTVTQMLCEHLGADRVFYAEIDEALSEAVVERDFNRTGNGSLAGRHSLEVFGWMASSPKKGEAAMIEDVRVTTLIPEADRAKVATLQLIAFISVPLVKDNRVVGALCVTQMKPRVWQEDEFELVKETAERTWAAVERARAEAALRRSEERMQRVLETETVGVLFFEWSGTVVHANDVFYRMTGYTQEDVANRSLTWQRMTPTEFIPSCERHVQALKLTGRLGPLEKEYIMKDGSRRWMLLAGRDLGDGTFSEYCIDITDRKRAEAALRESEERFRLFLENVHEYALIQCDRELLITSWNPGAERIFGYSSKEVLGQPFTMLMFPEERTQEVPCMQVEEVERRGRTEDARWLVRKDGQRIWTRWVSEPLKDNEGSVIGLTKVLRDETERLRAETSLRESEKLAVVGRMASSIAHEINNPLEAVTNLIFLARKATGSSQVADFLDVAQSELARVSHISKATLHYHRQSSDPLKVDVEEILESVLLLHEGRLRAAHISLDRRYGPHPPIRCKENEIRQVLANLVSNALDAMVKNPEERRRMIVRVRKAADPRTGEEGVRLMVADTGEGIGDDAGKRVFEPFYTTKAATGTGLGLWLSSETIKKHDGALHFRSRTGGGYRGTVFSMFLKS